MNYGQAYARHTLALARHPIFAGFRCLRIRFAHFRIRRGISRWYILARNETRICFARAVFNMNTTTTTQNIHAATNITPEFIALPRSGTRDKVFGLPRSTYYRLAKCNLIRLVRIRRPGQIHGRVLIDCGSVRKYIARMASEQSAGEAITATP